MLILTVQNIFTDREDVADYHWRLRINTRLLDEGFIMEHNRADGAVKLLERVVAAAGKGLTPVGGGEEKTTVEAKVLGK